jgi:hypothetical protein
MGICSTFLAVEGFSDDLPLVFINYVAGPLRLHDLHRVVMLPRDIRNGTQVTDGIGGAGSQP